MTDLATGTADAASDTTAHIPQARISEGDMNKLADKVSEAARQKTEREREEAADKALKDDQEKAFERAAKRGSRRDASRDDAGKFKTEADNTRDAVKALAPNSEPKEAGKNDQQPKADAKTPAESAQSKAEDKAEPVSAPAVKQPKSWSPDKKDLWDTLSPDAQKQIEQREQDVHKEISRLGQFAKGMQPMAETLSAYKDVFESKGLTFHDGVKQLLEAQRMLDRDPVSALQQIAKAYGVDLLNLAAASNDPTHQLRGEIAELRRQLEDSQRHQSQARQAEVHQRQDTLERTISDWAKDKPDFKTLEPEMAVLAPQILQAEPGISPVDVLERAYERAQWANPETRARLIEARERAAEAKRQEEAKKAQDAAKRANAINVTSSPTPAGEGELAAMQAAAFDRALNRNR